MKGLLIVLAALLVIGSVNGAVAEPPPASELPERHGRVTDRVEGKDTLPGEGVLETAEPLEWMQSTAHLLDPLVLECREAPSEFRKETSTAASTDLGAISRCASRYFRAIERCTEQLSRCHRQAKNQRQKELCFYSFLGCIDVAFELACADV